MNLVEQYRLAMQGRVADPYNPGLYKPAATMQSQPLMAQKPLWNSYFGVQKQGPVAPTEQERNYRLYMLEQYRNENNKAPR